MGTYHKWFPPGSTHPCWWVRRAAELSPTAAPAVAGPAKPASALDCMTILTWNSELSLPMCKNGHGNGQTKRSLDCVRYRTSTPVSYSNSHQWFYTIATQNRLVGWWENVVNDCSRVHRVHLLIPGASRNAFICQRAYSAQLSSG